MALFYGSYYLAILPIKKKTLKSTGKGPAPGGESLRVGCHHKPVATPPRLPPSSQPPVSLQLNAAKVLGHINVNGLQVSPGERKYMEVTQGLSEQMEGRAN